MQRTRRRVIGAALAVLGTLVANAAAARAPSTAPLPPQRPAATNPATNPAASPATAPRIERPVQRQSGIAGWMLVDLDSGEIIDQQAADTPFAPASVSKLPTALYALDRLGPEHRFETRLATTGTVKGDTLQGNLILVGGGDPELDSDELMVLVTQLQQRGIRRVTGRFLVDGSAAPQMPAIDGDQPVDAAYNPALSGLDLNFNRVRLKWDARSKDQTLRVSAQAGRLDPEVAGVKVTLATYPGAPVFTHSFEGQTEIWRMNQASLRGKGARWLPVRQPALYAGEVFRGLARDYGIALGPAQAGVAPEGDEVIARHQSRELALILKYMLRYSTNLTAELVGLAATRAGGAEPRSLAESAQALNAWVAANAGFAPGDPGFRLANHSGLTPDSRVSPRRLVGFLAAMAQRQSGSGQPVAEDGLPGITAGLLKSYNVAAKGINLDYRHLKIAAKTGTMDYVRGLAGYIVTPSGRRLAFAIFSNDLDRRRPGAQRVNRRWLARARAFERALIRDWVLALKG